MKRYIWGFVFFFIVSIITGILLLNVTNAPEFEKRKDGSIESIILKELTFFDTSCGKIKTKDSVYFHNNGKIEIALLSEPQFIDTSLGKLKVNMITFYKNGNLCRAGLSEPQFIDSSLGKLKVKDIDFFKGGAVKRIVLCEARSIVVQSEKIKTQVINFFESGQIRFLMLYEKQLIGSDMYNEESLIELNKTGEIIKLSQARLWYNVTPPPTMGVEEHQLPVDDKD